MTNEIIGVDIGGSHITAGLVDLRLQTLDEHSIVRRSVNAQGKADEIISEWTACINAVKRLSKGVERISVAMPGPFDYEKGIALMKGQGKYDQLYGLDVRHLLAASLNMPPEYLVFSNDAACFLAGEVSCGAARGANKAIGLTLGTGLGTAKYADGIADDAGLWNTPYKEGTLENYLSTGWFVRAYKEITGESIKGVYEIADLGRKHPVVQSIFSEFSVHLSTFLKFFIKKQEPEVVVLGGNITKTADLFLPKVQSELETSWIKIPIKTTSLGERAALVGAAFNWGTSKTIEQQ